MKFEKDMLSKEELIINKQLRQSTTKILRRPSYFQAPANGSPVSPEVLKALLQQRKTGSLANSTLQDWVDRFEKEFEDFQSKNSKEHSYEYIEKQFQALHQELTKKEKDMTVSHQPLDSAPAKHKLKLGRQRAQSKDRKGSRDDVSSPKQGARFQATNFTREFISHSTTASFPYKNEPVKNGLSDNPVKTAKSGNTAKKKSTQVTPVSNTQQQTIIFELGKEPDVNTSGPSSSSRSVPCSTSPVTSASQPAVTSGPGGKSNSFVTRLADRMTGSIDRVSKKKSPKLENVYEEIPSYAQVKKTPRKKNKAPAPVDGLYEEISLYHSTANNQGSSAATDGEQQLPIAALRQQLNLHDEELQSDTEIQLARRKKTGGPTAPFEKFQNCLFSVFTTCTPWCVMRQVYWKKDDQSEEIFTIRSRQNRRQKRESVISSPASPAL